jgi:hypothetical protein
MKNGAARPRICASKTRKSNDVFISAKAEEREHGNHDDDQPDDVDDGIHGEDSSC